MFNVSLDNSNEITVKNRTKEIRFAVDSSGMNPLEAFYASLAGCAAVYAKKACKELNIPADGIHIICRPSAGPGGPLTLARFETVLQFAERYSNEEIRHIQNAVQHCAVKEVVTTGASIEFLVRAEKR